MPLLRVSPKSGSVVPKTVGCIGGGIMTLAEILQRATALPKEKQEELSDFVEFLLSRTEAKPALTEHTELRV